MHKILLLEDDLAVAELINSSLSSIGTISHATTIEQAASCIDKKFFDVAIIDRVLPDGDGLETIAYLRDISYQTKIIALSTKSATQERILGLEHGADDYMPKPFSISELELKVKKFLHMDKRSSSTIITTNCMKFSPQTGEVWIKDKLITLRKKESQIFHCLVRHKNQVLSREKIVSESWTIDEEIPSQSTLDVYIRRIRMVLTDLSDHIVTKRGFGYSFIE